MDGGASLCSSPAAGSVQQRHRRWRHNSCSRPNNDRWTGTAIQKWSPGSCLFVIIKIYIENNFYTALFWCASLFVKYFQYQLGQFSTEELSDLLSFSDFATPSTVAASTVAVNTSVSPILPVVVWPWEITSTSIDAVVTEAQSIWPGLQRIVDQLPGTIRAALTQIFSVYVLQVYLASCRKHSLGLSIVLVCPILMCPFYFDLWSNSSR